MADTNFDRMRRVLDEVFMLDQADLDFGIYRIMNVKRDEITRFLDSDLLPQVKETLAGVDEGLRAQVKQELDELEASVTKAGMKPGDSPKVQELRAKYKAGTDIEALENEVYSHLASFFRRYYKEGDYLSLRRYKEGVYALPYEGEEVKLHWANADQYYIKSTEQFRDYAFKLGDGRRVHFKLTSANTESDNNKPAVGQERRFILAETDPVAEQDGELTICFEYRPDPEGRKREALNAEAEPEIMAAVPNPWKAALTEKRPTEKNPDRTLLAKHLNDYTARNTFDYFIHKDLGSFLRRELDFYIKNEVMHLDDIENETAPKVDSYLAKIRAIRKIAHKIIDFLAQLEDFQKKLWLKKKFVIETSYCVTLNLVPEGLYPEIAANGAQREEWVRLLAIDEIQAALTQPAYSEPLSVEFLKSQPHLALDTRHFPDDFSDMLLDNLTNLNEQTDGVLIHSENLQALSLLDARYRDQIGCVYIDPPYNSKTTEIAYKNTYKHSSWITLMEGRLRLSKRLARTEGSHVVAIDENEQEVLGQLLSLIFPLSEKICVAVIHNKKGIQGDYFSYNHEYAFFCIPPDLPTTHGEQVPKEEWDFDNLRKWGRESERNTAKNCFYPIYVEGKEIVGFGDVCADDFHPGEANVPDGPRLAIYPVDSKLAERKWRYARDSVVKISQLLKVHVTTSGEVQIHKAKAELPIKTVWDASKYIAGDYGTKWLTDLGLKISEDLYPKSVHTVEDSIFALTEPDADVLDYFAGSGTTGHAVINLNRQDGGNRKYILVEMGDYFDTVLKPRIQKVIYSKDWKNGNPISREGSSHMFKCIRLESYEDALNNLELKSTETQQKLLSEHPDLHEDYTLRYMLDVEAKGSASLLNIDAFEDPFSYKLNVASGSAGETRPVNVDLVETFNYLIGLRVKTIDHIQGFRVVTGESPAGEKLLVIWRNSEEKSNKDLDEFFRKQGYTTKDQEFDVIYVNGDNNLENLRREDETWKVRLIEENFQRLMFDVQDVQPCPQRRRLVRCGSTSGWSSTSGSHRSSKSLTSTT